MTDPKEVKAHIIAQSQKHFKQAQGTPFTVAPLADIQTAQDESVKTVLQPGLPIQWQNVSPAGWNDETVRFIERLVRNDSIPAINSSIDIEEFKKGIKKWKEKTATSPSGHHLGHLHSLLAPDGIHKSDEEESTKELADNILQLHLDMINLTIQWGYAPQRWRNVVLFVLEKESGKPKIHRLQNIHLYEADYNFVLKLLWSKRLICHAECHRLINTAQWGSRPRCRASDAVLQKATQYELMYALWKQLVAMELDARACYDRIIATCAMLISMMHGMPAEACQMQKQMLEEASFQIKTSLGISSETFSNSKLSPVYGNGQGSGSSPPVWVLISSVFLDEMDLSKYRAEFTDPTGTVHQDSVMVVYVNDSGTMINNFPTGEGVQAMRAVAQKWEKLLFSTGGALAPGKCFFYLVTWEWDSQGKASIQKKHALDDPLLLHAGHGFIPQEVPRKEVTEGHRTLGIRLDPAISFKEETIYLKQVADKIARRLQKNALNKEETRVAYRSMYLPKVGYSAAVASLTVQQCHQVKQRAVRAFLGSLGYNANMPRVVVQAPETISGIGLTSLHNEQGIEHITALSRHMRDRGQIGSFLTILLRTCQLLSGRTTSIFRKPFVSLDYLQEFKQKWALKVRDTLSRADTEMFMTNEWTPKVCREGDMSLMEFFASNGSTTNELAQLNCCRIFLQVTTLSEICDATGTRILGACLDHPTQHFRRSKLSWPNQASPGPKQWTLWRSALKPLLANDLGKLCTRLGPWKIPLLQLDQSWEWWYDTETESLVHEDGVYSPDKTARASRRPRFKKHHDDTQVNIDPLCGVPAEVSIVSPNDQVTASFSQQAIPPTVTVSWDQFLLSEVKWNIIPEDTQDFIELGIGVWMVSDASKQESKGTFAWAIADYKDIYVSNTGMVCGCVESITSY